MGWVGPKLVKTPVESGPRDAYTSVAVSFFGPTGALVLTQSQQHQGLTRGVPCEQCSKLGCAPPWILQALLTRPAQISPVAARWVPVFGLGQLRGSMSDRDYRRVRARALLSLRKEVRNKRSNPSALRVPRETNALMKLVAVLVTAKRGRECGVAEATYIAARFLTARLARDLGAEHAAALAARWALAREKSRAKTSRGAARGRAVYTDS